jgi:hypothetical protein
MLWVSRRQNKVRVDLVSKSVNEMQETQKQKHLPKVFQSGHGCHNRGLCFAKITSHREYEPSLRSSPTAYSAQQSRIEFPPKSTQAQHLCLGERPEEAKSGIQKMPVWTLTLHLFLAKNEEGRLAEEKSYSQERLQRHPYWTDKQTPKEER